MARGKPETRIMARWCERWEQRADGEWDMGDQMYAMDECANLKEAAELARSKDIFGEGAVLIEEWRHQAYGLYDWEEVKCYDVYEIDEVETRNGRDEREQS